MSELDRQPHQIPDAVPQSDAERAAAQAHVTRSQTSADRRGLGWKGPTAGLVLIGAVAATAFGLGSKSGGGDPSPSPDRDPRPTAASTATPGNNPSEKPEGQPTTSLEGLNTPASAELIQEATQEISAADYPTPEAALERAGELLNVYFLSGQLDDDNEYTVQSLEDGQAIVENISGSDISSFTENSHFTDFRRNLAGVFHYIDVQYSEEQNPTWQIKLEPTNASNTGGDVYNYDANFHVTHNLTDLLGGDDANNFFTLDQQQPDYTLPVSGSMVKEDGTWHVISLNFND